MSATKYRYAADVADIAEKLIADVHTDLADVPIRYIYRDKAQNRRGHAVLGTASKVTGRNAALVALADGESTDAEAFYLIEIAEDTWTALTQDQRVALVDHELCHFVIEQPDDPAKQARLTMRGHDVEEFTDVIERHGLWRPPIAELARIMRETPGQLDIGEQLIAAADTD
jgi:predicted metallopeptidase